MGLAKYFFKDQIALSQVLNTGSAEVLHDILNAQVIEIAFDDSVKCIEGKATLDMVIRLIARLYPKLKCISLTQDNKVVNSVQTLAESINSNIEFTEDNPTVSIVIGNTKIRRNNHPIFYVGSDKWKVKLSASEPVSSGDSNLPFAAGVAACFGVSNVFRYVFRDHLEFCDLDSEVYWSIINSESDSHSPTIPKVINIGSIAVVGVGAIGNGVAWSLANYSSLKGEIKIIDHEEIDESNLQRYVMSVETDIGSPKVDVITRQFTNRKIKILPFKKKWDEYLNFTQNWNDEIVLVAVDTAADRIAIQSSLPKLILNAYTGNKLVGITRHYDFLNRACLACAYIPEAKKKNLSEEVAENLGIPDKEKEIRKYLHYNSPVDHELIKFISDANSVSLDQLAEFVGLPINKFYSDIVCGSTLLNVKSNQDKMKRIEVPLSFQSALAGILLAAELVIRKSKLIHGNLAITTQINPLAPIKPGKNPYNHNIAKNEYGRCICSDDEFREIYKNKWNRIRT